MSQMMRIHQTLYKKAFAFLSKDLPDIRLQTPDTWKEFLLYSGLDDDEATQAVMMNGSAPLIFPANLGPAVFGQFDTQVPGRIEISRDVLDWLESNPENTSVQTFLRAKVLHEICHWGCFLKHKPDKDQSGEAFETAVFGKQLLPDWTTNTNTALTDTALPKTGFNDPQTRASLLESLLTKHADAPGRVEDPDHAVFSGANVAEAMPRGFRNNNPGNIRISQSSAWRGLADPDDKENFQLREKNFCVFREPEWGLRAIAILLRKYKSEYGLDTPRKIIARWAPASDNNDVDSYADQLAKALGVTPDGPADATVDVELIKMMRAIARHENGAQPPYAEVQYQTALILAG